jgi:tetratricopeptide (TPR) repeat protein
LFEKGKDAATRFNRSILSKILYARAAIEKGMFDTAIEELRKAKILAGKQNELLVQIISMEADLYYKEKKYKKSFECFEDALKIDKNDLIILNNYAYYLSEQNIELKKAEIMAKKVIEKDGKNTTYLDTYAWVLFKLGKLKEASKIMETIINSGEKADAEWYEHYGFILKGLKKCEKAIEYWKLAMEIENTKKHLIKEIENCRKKN